MENLFSAYFKAGYFGGIMILLVLLLRPVLQKAPRKAMCIVWLLVAVRLLLPFAMESKLSLQPQHTPYEQIATMPGSEHNDNPVPSPVLPDTPPALNEPIPDSSQSVQKPAEPVPDSSQNTQTPAEPVPDIPQDVSKPVEPVQILSVIWVSVAGAVLLYVVGSSIVLKYRVRDAVRCEDGVLECDRIRGAFLLGYITPKIYLPSGLSLQDRSMMIAHERVHMRRGDNWWKLMGFLCICVHWYNPLVWIAYVMMCQDMEAACDEQVIRTMSLEDRKVYSLALLRSGKRVSGYFVYPVAFGEVNLKHRIKNVLSYRNPDVWITVAAAVLVIFVAVCFMTTPEPQTRDVSGEHMQAQTPETQAPTGNGETTAPTDTPTNPTVNDSPSTEPSTTAPPVTNPTAPPATVPNPTAPPATAPNQNPDNGDHVLADGKWNGRPVTWQITKAGVLTISGNGTVQTADSYAWQEYSDYVTKIVLEDGITYVPNNAFKDMKKVTDVYLGNGVTVVGQNAFQGCSALRSVTIPAGTKKIDRYAFDGCRDLSTVTFASNSQLQIIEQRAFSQSGITSFVSPANLRSIQGSAFYGCESLQTLVLETEGLQVADKAFHSCPAIKHLVIGEGVNVASNPAPDSLALETLALYIQIGNFSNLTTLKSVILGGSITHLPDYFFHGCTALSDVTVSVPITKIGADAFRNCTALKSFTIPGSVTELGAYAFAGSGLTSIAVPESVTSWGDGVFSSCKNLKTATLPGNMKEVPPSTFEWCGLVSIRIPASVTVIELYAFGNCQNLQSVTLQEGLIAIGGMAFSGSGLTSITIPASVETIASYAFASDSIKEIVFLGDAPREFNDMALSGVTATAYYPKNNTTWTADKLKQYGGNITWVPR